MWMEAGNKGESGTTADQASNAQVRRGKRKKQILFLEQSQLFLIILFKLLRLLAYFNFNYEKDWSNIYEQIGPNYACIVKKLS